ncbi:MAG: bifunctional adenosylcobinamide kinase/adenosylcobinamide-phosphate guanylyltransferase [Firmicutes bacterium]|nr:bifunctional adenosylcobinamide kinase/adenosylcobinamide-phosphate guanylyltransferase [Bacillota bacterium]
MISNLILITGGARSGKSRFAEQLATSLGARVAYVATATPGDEEMKARIEMHRGRRPPGWETIEEPCDVSKAIELLTCGQCGHDADVVLVDCITLLVSNLLTAGKGEDAVLEEISRLAEVARTSRIPVIIVSNEVGMGIVPEYRLARLYRDVHGRANQILAAAAREVYVLFAGIPLEIKRLAQSPG